jgi:hypothetical protein
MRPTCSAVCSGVRGFRLVFFSASRRSISGGGSSTKSWGAVSAPHIAFVTADAIEAANRLGSGRASTWQ